MSQTTPEPGGTPPAGTATGFSLAAVERFLMAASMGVLCLLTMANVLVRYFTDISFAFTEEISVALLVVMTLVGASHAFATRHHIAITFLVDKRPALAALAHRFGLVCGLLMFGLLAGYGVLMAWDDYSFEVTSPSLGVPQWWYTVWLPVLSILIVLRLLAQLIQRGEH
ncbi:TRAP transporter small permease [Zoogloea sp.]|jgi:TRAP-type C4-dicarboxylate transport system permease small subunit|uniref:TRAP transporter small permease n=1 Tax=Zoogloea sp. TaxID=49181 RepID=UPI0035B13D75|nr:TRAP transporter small permease [Rhodocyclales bacterium]